MKTIKNLVTAALFAATAIAAPPSAAMVYQNTGTTGLSSPAGSVSYLEAITPVGTGTFNLSALTFGVGVGVGVAANSAASTQGVFIDF